MFLRTRCCQIGYRRVAAWTLHVSGGLAPIIMRRTFFLLAGLWLSEICLTHDSCAGLRSAFLQATSQVCLSLLGITYSPSHSVSWSLICIYPCGIEEVFLQYGHDAGLIHTWSD